MQFCCGLSYLDYPLDEQTTVLGSVNLSQEKFEIIGQGEHYSLALLTVQYIQEQIQQQEFPQLLNIIADDQKFCNKPQKIFIPHSNDEQLLQYFLERNNSQIYTHKTNQGITQLPFSRQLEYIDQNCKNELDLTIFNFCHFNKDRIQTELNEFGKISKNKVIIFQFQKNIGQLISQVMKYQEETLKEELQLVHINGREKYYLFFLGNLNSTRKIQRKNIIANILSTQEQKKVILMLEYLYKQSYKYKDMIKHIAQIKQKFKEQLLQQQSVKLLDLFINSISNEKHIDRNTIQEFFNCSQLSDTNDSRLNFTLQRAKSFGKTNIARTQSILSSLI